MAGALSNTFETRVYDWLFRPGQAVTRPTNIYLSLWTVVTDAEAVTGTEVTGGSYARVDVTSAFSASSNGVGSNTGDVVFAAPTGTWGLAIAFGLHDAISGGNPVSALITLTQSKQINNGDPAPKFSAGQLTITVD